MKKQKGIYDRSETDDPLSGWMKMVKRGFGLNRTANSMKKDPDTGRFNVDTYGEKAKEHYNKQSHEVKSKISHHLREPSDADVHTQYKRAVEKSGGKMDIKERFYANLDLIREQMAPAPVSNRPSMNRPTPIRPSGPPTRPAINRPAYNPVTDKSFVDRSSSPKDVAQKAKQKAASRLSGGLNWQERSALGVDMQEAEHLDERTVMSKKAKKGTKWKVIARNPDGEGSDVELRQGKRRKMVGGFYRDTQEFDLAKTKKGKMDMKDRGKTFKSRKEILDTVSEEQLDELSDNTHMSYRAKS